jgi:hypothetical protein
LRVFFRNRIKGLKEKQDCGFCGCAFCRDSGFGRCKKELLGKSLMCLSGYITPLGFIPDFLLIGYNHVIPSGLVGMHVFVKFLLIRLSGGCISICRIYSAPLGLAQMTI